MRDSSEIQAFYNEKSILLTGCTGFLGKILLEKLLRCCNVKKVYCLTRDKKGMAASERFKKLFDSPIFHNLKRQQPNFTLKLAMVNGDCSMENLNLHSKDKQFLVENIDVIFHIAATIRFNQTLKTATQINVKTIRYLVDIAKEMKNLKAFVYTSSAYSNCGHDVIHETIYKNKLSVHKFLSIIDDLDDEFVDRITPFFLGKLPNTYVFTKALAEELLLDYGKLECKLPIVIVRPSILSSAYKEPLPGWIDTWFTVGSISAAVSYGLLRSVNTNPDKVADIVPSDYVANCIIASSLKAVYWNKNELQIPIFNFVSSVESPITWGEYTLKCFKLGLHYIPSQCCRYPDILMTKYSCLHKLRVIYMHQIPAYLLDVMLHCLGSKISLRQFYQLLHTFLDETCYFSTRQWKFYNNNTQQLWNDLSSQDQQLFPFSMKDFNWNDYILQFLKQGRVYLLKDDLTTLPHARKKLKVLKVIHYVLIFIKYSFLIWIDYLILRYFNFI